MLSRRSLYCSKFANGRYSIVPFITPEGNIRFKNLSHYWVGNRCGFCVASKSEYNRAKDLEQHAYEFIHTVKPEEIWKMKFDVIIGNPPYQLSDGGDSSEGARNRGGAVPIYQHFVQQAMKLNPRFLTMIIPSRWFAGGRGLDAFREEMLNDRRIRTLVDYPVSSECFPGVEIKGGICYFLWNRESKGDCLVETIRGNNKSAAVRPLLENDSEVFIRFNEAISIFRKVQEKNEESFSSLVSTQKPFGFRTYFEGKSKPFTNSVMLYTNKGTSYVSIDEIVQNRNWISQYKVFISMAYGAGEDFPHQIINKPIFGDQNSCCTETYLVVGPFSKKDIAYNVISYFSTRFFRFLVMLRKNTQHASKGVYKFVPVQDFTKLWTDAELYDKYGFSDEEIKFIESMIRSMDLEGKENA